MRTCRKCHTTLPTRATVDGKVRNLQKRKFCLECSPFGHHNTSATTPLTRTKRKSYPSWTKAQRQTNIEQTTKRGNKLKAKLIELFGGRCQIVTCGYARCMDALAFHHRDPKEKSFELGKTQIRSKPWEDILVEAAKCVLLCNRCHTEVHAGIILLAPVT